MPEKNPIDIDLYTDLPIEENTIVFNVKNRGDGSYDLLDADGETLYSNLNTKNNYNLNNIEINIKESWLYLKNGHQNQKRIVVKLIGKEKQLSQHKNLYL